MAQLFLVAAATNAAARQATVAATLAAQKVEQILSSAVVAADESVEHLDGTGRILGGGESPPSDAVYTRRWSIEAVTADSLMIRVRVGRSDRSGKLRRMLGETQMLTITRRTPP